MLVFRPPPHRAPSVLVFIMHVYVQSALETLLQQLVAARCALREEAGGMGEVFELRDYLL